jgi:hypothetical protein
VSSSLTRGTNLMSGVKGLTRLCEKCNFQIGTYSLKRHLRTCNGLGPESKRIRSPGVCEECGEKHNGAYGLARFCNIHCARRFSTKLARAAINKKLSERYIYNEQRQLKAAVSYIEKLKKSIITADWDILSPERKIKRLLLEQTGKCNKCGLYEWLNKPILLEYHHEDGNRENNNRENVSLLCLNCHSQTPTFRYRGKKKISKEILLTSLQKTRTIAQALIGVGLSPGAGNYIRARKLLELKT